MLYDPNWKSPSPVETRVEEGWRRVLRDAADHIERVGYWDGTKIGQRGDRACAMIAIGWAEDSGGYRVCDHEPEDRLAKYLGIPVFRIPAWSDSVGKEVVLASLRAAANSPG